MESLFILEAFKIVNLLAHLALMVCVGAQVFHPRISNRQWREAWFAIFMGMLLILPFRIADLFADPDYWRLLLAAPMTMCLFFGFYQLAQITKE